MNILWQRNLKMFFRDKMAVFYSLFSVLIIVLLYALFLGDQLIAGLDGAPYGDVLIITWLTAGLVSVGGISAAIQGMGQIVEDRVKKIDKCFRVAPISRGYLVRGYMASSVVISFMMPMITFVGMSVYLYAISGSLFTLAQLAQIVAITVLSAVASTAILYLMVSSMKSNRAFSTGASLLATLSGFIMGVYIPVGFLPSVAQSVVMLFPPSHVTVLLRQIMMQQAKELAFANAPESYLQAFNADMGVTLMLGGWEVTWVASVGYLVLATLVCYGLSVYLTSQKSNP